MSISKFESWMWSYLGIIVEALPFLLIGAVLSAIIYNALIIVALIPLALKGVKYREVPAGELLKRNLLIYGLGGIIVPFICIKIIDVILVGLGLV